MFYFLFFFSKSKNAIDFVHTRVIPMGKILFWVWKGDYSDLITETFWE